MESGAGMGLTLVADSLAFIAWTKSGIDSELELLRGASDDQPDN
jgi:hypothetical protein